MGTYWFLCLKLLFSLSHGLSVCMHVSFSSPLSTHLLLMCSLHVFNSQRYLKSYRFSVKLARTVCCAIFLFSSIQLNWVSNDAQSVACVRYFLTSLSFNAFDLTTKKTEKSLLQVVWLMRAHSF